MHKQKDSEKQTDQGPVGAQGDLFKVTNKSKGKEKGITIKKPTP